MLDRDAIAPVYANLIAISILPFIMIVLAFWIWSLVKIRNPTMPLDKFRHHTKGTIINLLFLVYPTILKVTVQIFACSPILGTSYLDVYMEDECWTGDHWTYTTSVAIPALLLWGIGLPFLACFVLYKNARRRRLDTRKNREVYGFLYLGFHPKKYWWEFVIVIRKVTLLMTLVWLNHISVESQVVVLLLIIIIAYRLQYATNPYRTELMNYIETLSLVVSFLTVYVGLWYLTVEIENEQFKIFIFVMLIITNVIFVIFWLIAYIRSRSWPDRFVKYFRF